MIGDGESACRSICMRSSSPSRTAASYMAGVKFARGPPPDLIVKRPPASSAAGALLRNFPAPRNASTGKKCEWRAMFIRLNLRTPEIDLKKLERPRPRLFRGLGMITIRRVGVKAVLRAGIDLVRVRFAVLLHRLDRAGNILVHAGIFLAVVREHRRLDGFHAIERLRAPSVEDYDGGKPAHLRRRREGHLAAPAEADRPEAVAADGLERAEIVARGGRVFGDVLPRREHRRLDRFHAI